MLNGAGSPLNGHPRVSSSTHNGNSTNSSNINGAMGPGYAHTTRRPLTTEEYERELRATASDLELVERVFRTGMASNQLRSALWPHLFGLVKQRGHFVRRPSLASGSKQCKLQAANFNKNSISTMTTTTTTTTNSTGLTSSAANMTTKFQSAKHQLHEASNNFNHNGNSYSQAQQEHLFQYIEHEDNVKRWRELEKQYRVYENQWKSIQSEQELRFSMFRERKSIIERDVVRSDRTHPFYSSSNPNTGENLRNLTRVLMSYMMYDFDIGYLQGMSDLVAPILYVFQGDVVKTFWVFVEVMKLFRRNFEFSQKTIHFQLNCLFRLIKLTDAKLAAYLRETDCSNCFFVFRHIVCQFKRELMRASSDSQTSTPAESSNDDESTSYSSSSSSSHCPTSHKTSRDDYLNVLNLWDSIWFVQRRHELRAKSKCVHTFKIAKQVASNKTYHQNHANNDHHNHHHHHQHPHNHHHQHTKASTTTSNNSRKSNLANTTGGGCCCGNSNSSRHCAAPAKGQHQCRRTNPTSTSNHSKQNHCNQNNNNNNNPHQNRHICKAAPNGNNVTSSTNKQQVTCSKRRSSGSSLISTSESCSSVSSICSSSESATSQSSATSSACLAPCCKENGKHNQEQQVVKQEQVVYTKETFYSSFDPNQADVPRFELSETEKFVISLCLSLIRRERQFILEQQLDASEIHQHFIRPRLASDLEQFLGQAYEIYHFLNNECDLPALFRGASEFARPSELSPIDGIVSANLKNTSSSRRRHGATELAGSASAPPAAPDTFDLLKDYFIISPTAYNLSTSSLSNNNNNSSIQLSNHYQYSPPAAQSARSSAKATPTTTGGGGGGARRKHSNGFSTTTNITATGAIPRNGRNSWDQFVGSTQAIR